MPGFLYAPFTVFDFRSRCSWGGAGEGEWGERLFDQGKRFRGAVELCVAGRATVLVHAVEEVAEAIG